LRWRPSTSAACAARACHAGLLPLRLLRAFWQAWVVRRVRPDVVVGLGGYITPGG
jgi:UDP-N-acetylglucosamine:LPS N-acetylglucosamine transferase